MQPYHRIAFEWPSEVRLELEWAGGAEGSWLEPPGREYLQECWQELELDPLGLIGIPAICWRPSEDSLFEPLQLRENAEYLVDIRLPISFGEAETAWRQNRSWPLLTVRNAYESDPPRRWRVNGRFVTITGRLNFGSYVGLAELLLPHAELVATEVVCTKISYFDDFRRLMEAIAEEYTSLLLEIEAPTFTRFTLADAPSPQLMTFLFLLRHAMDDSRLPAAVEGIIASPRSTLIQYEQIVPTGMQRNLPEGDFLHRLPEGMLTPGGPLGGLFRQHTPTAIPETVKMETFDTPENRYVKAFIENLRDAAEDLRDRLTEHGKTAVGRQVHAWSIRIAEWLEHPIWNDVRRMTHFPSNSQVLQKAPSYREVLGTDLGMQLGMALPWSADSQLESDVHGDLRPISQLYEYWCFFFLRSVLRNICGEELRGGGSLVRETDDGLNVVLKRGTESRVQFRFQDEAGRTALVSLYYNRRFERLDKDVWNGSYSAHLNPDFSVLIDVVADPEEGRVHWLHFDAKYRLDIGHWRHMLIENLNQLPQLEAELVTSAEDARVSVAYKRTDLFKMHTYRDALLGSRGSYLLFPGTDDGEEIFIRYPGIEHSATGPHIPSVGAFQARPSQQTTQSHRLEEFIAACVRRLVGAVSYQEETGVVSAGD